MSLERTVENVYLRQDASQLVRKHFWPLLGMMLATQLLNNGAEKLLTALGDVITAAETNAVISSINQSADAAPVTEALTNLFASPVYWLYNLIYLLITLMVSQTLMLGSTAEYIRAGYGLTPQVRGIFSRARYCLKALGLSLLTYLKVTLWMLPGLTLIFADATIMQGASSTFLMLVGIGLMLGLAIPAILRYAMAVPILADEPDRSICECITLSKGLMAGRKVQYCKLLALPLAVSAIIAGVVNSVITTTFSASRLDYATIMTISGVMCALATLYWTMQLDLLPALFYLKRRTPAPDAPVSYWLKEHTATDIEEPSPEDTSPENTNEEENHHEQPDC